MAGARLTHGLTAEIKNASLGYCTLDVRIRRNYRCIRGAGPVSYQLTSPFQAEPPRGDVYAISAPHMELGEQDGPLRSVHVAVGARALHDRTRERELDDVEV